MKVNIALLTVTDTRTFDNDKSGAILVNKIKEDNHKLFWENGNKKMITNFLNGQYEGKMIQWHENGKKFKEFYYKNGNEVSNQKIWDSKGNIKANYDVVNGRRYGLTGQKNCVSSNEIF